MKLVTAAIAAAGLFASCSAALPSVTQKGRYFFDSNGNRVFFKGVAYQLYSTGPNTDPFVDVGQCQRDASLMKQLGVNSIRTYHVRSYLNHDACMKIFDDAGIYLFVDLDDYDTQLDQTQPQWTNRQRLAFQAVVDAFAKYDNVAGFFIGNEVINIGDDSGVAVYIKAAVRDMKNYIKSQKYRTIPIGYSHADVQSIGQNLENYFACGSPDNGMLDFYGLNSYRWCGNNTFMGSGYSDILEQTKNYPIPLIMSETGCNQPEPRLFQDQNSLLGPDMDEVWSGAIIYEWLQEENHFGLVTYDGGITDALIVSQAPPNGWPRSGTPTPVTPDFNNLSNVWKTLHPTGTIKAADYSPSLSPLPCPSYQAGSWQVSGDAPLPTASGADIQPSNSAPQATPAASSTPSPTPIPPSSGVTPTGFPSTITSIANAQPTGSGTGNSSNSTGASGGSMNGSAALSSASLRASGTGTSTAGAPLQSVGLFSGAALGLAALAIFA